MSIFGNFIGGLIISRLRSSARTTAIDFGSVATVLDAAAAYRCRTADRDFRIPVPRGAGSTLLHRPQTELVQKPHVPVAAGVRRGEQLRPVKDRIGAGEEAQSLRVLAHVLAYG